MQLNVKLGNLAVTVSAELEAAHAVMVEISGSQFDMSEADMRNYFKPELDLIKIRRMGLAMAGATSARPLEPTDAPSAVSDKFTDFNLTREQLNEVKSIMVHSAPNETALGGGSYRAFFRVHFPCFAEEAFDFMDHDVFLGKASNVGSKQSADELLGKVGIYKKAWDAAVAALKRYVTDLRNGFNVWKSHTTKELAKTTKDKGRVAAKAVSLAAKQITDEAQQRQQTQVKPTSMPLVAMSKDDLDALAVKPISEESWIADPSKQVLLTPVIIEFNSAGGDTKTYRRPCRQTSSAVTACGRSEESFPGVSLGERSRPKCYFRGFTHSPGIAFEVASKTHHRGQ